MKWQELSGKERYRVVEMARKGEVPLKEICTTFGVSRQTLYRAMRRADEASEQALEPKSPGRKRTPEEETRIRELEGQMSELSQQLKHWKTKYEIAEAFLDLERQYDRGELEETPAPTARGKKWRKRPVRGKSKRGKKG